MKFNFALDSYTFELNAETDANICADPRQVVLKATTANHCHQWMLQAS